MNLEKRIEALEQESARLAEPHKVVVAIWNEDEGTEDEAIDRALAEAGMTREDISKPGLDGLPRIFIVHAVKPDPSRFPETTPAEPSGPVASEASKVVDIKSPPPVRERPLPLPITGIL